MVKPSQNLFQIGETAKFLDVSRKMILNYEELGLLVPAYKDEASGYRYYTVDNFTQIRSIRSLQSLGLSLSEIKEYYYDVNNIEEQIKRFTELRAVLDKNIQLLQARASKKGEMTVRHTVLPKQVCFCRRFCCRDIPEATIRLRETYIDAAKTGLLSNASRMFSARIGKDPAELDLLFCIPVKDEFKGPERTVFSEAPALCIFYRGPYEGTKEAIAALRKYIEGNHIKTDGPYRSIYLEGPLNRGKNVDNYITQIAVPIADRRLEHFDTV